MEIKTVVQGYKLKNYNATYELRTFLFQEKIEDGNRTIKVIDSQSGEEIWINVPLKVETPKRKA